MSDWLRLNKAQICFDMATSVLGGVEFPLGYEVEKKCPVVEVKLPPRMAVSCDGRIDRVEKLTEGLY